MTGSSWAYPIAGQVAQFPEGDAEFDVKMHYFTKAREQYTPSGVLRSMALFIDGLEETQSVEAMFVYPEFTEGYGQGWAGMVAVYHDRPAA
jgi:hypothetical protein